MFPAATVPGAVVTPTPSANATTAQKTSQPQAPETARTSAGESAAANIKAETSKAVQAPEQTSVAPRLRDQETAERTDRADRPEPFAGPPPTFEESPLERQARVAFDPPEASAEAPSDREPVATSQADEVEAAPEIETAPAPEEPADPPPTKTERAEASFSETKTISEPNPPASFDVAR